MIKDKSMDQMINDVIDIFKSKEVELVRLSGLTNREARIANIDINKEIMDNIIHKLKFAGVINYEYITICPHCGEVSYQIKPIETNGKICDTCASYYFLSPGKSLINN